MRGGEPTSIAAILASALGIGHQVADLLGPSPVEEATVRSRDGYVAYQSGWGPQPMGGPPWYTGLEVSYNPSDVWPTIACFVIAFGLLWHFLAKL